MSSSNLIRRQVDKYDGQSIFIGGLEVYELGNYLGGGASGSVYQATDLSSMPSERQVAIKILNPVGFKLLPANQLCKCDVMRKGLPLTIEQHQGKNPMVADNVWWIYHSLSRQVLAAYEDPRSGQLRELTLPKCVEVWGWSPFGERDHQMSNDEEEKQNIASFSYLDGASRPIPIVAPKFLKWLKNRQSICREMGSMMQLGEHRNIIKLFEVLELIQDSKTTLFLVLELVTGGEMFERMKAGRGNSESTGRKYFKQLLSGIEYCHERGVCHRDLKPENLLLSDASENAILKMADFGLSAVVFAAVAATEGLSGPMSACGAGQPPTTENESEKHLSLDDLPPSGSPVKRLRSVVGSPHYVAPEITDVNAAGYDGRKVDMWSAGVILYGILTGSLPFGRDLSICPRYKRFKYWITTDFAVAMHAGKEPLYPSWFFPSNISPIAKSLIVQLLHPDPLLRLSASDALQHRWITSVNSNQQITRTEDINHGNTISRQPSPNSCKMSGKPPLPLPGTSRQDSPTQQETPSVNVVLNDLEHNEHEIANLHEIDLGNDVVEISEPVCANDEDIQINKLSIQSCPHSNPIIVETVYHQTS